MSGDRYRIAETVVFLVTMLACLVVIQWCS